ncbi:HotDog domain-containing protein [Lactarius quietus]|nr:HotDog domain-containing protein [Lactarius quietus]KAF8265201.1 HotDog domain-containing protein [Lactarius quietus]
MVLRSSISTLVGTTRTPHLMSSLSPAAALSVSVSLLPGLAKSVVFLLVILNVRSLPLVWHLRVLFWPLSRVWWLSRRARIRTFSSSSTSKKDAHRNCDYLVPVGQNPLDHVSVTKSWAGPDDCDYNWHLSNSSYSKVLDVARSNSVVNILPSFVIAGGAIALAGTHFQFIREIPIFARYEVRSQIVGWDHKWLYVVHRFVSRHKPGLRRTAPAITNGIDSDSPSPTPTPSDSSADLSADAVRAAAATAHEPEPDGATLHCISVNVMVFKQGRITVPPALVLAGEGFGATHLQGAAARARAVELGLGGMRELHRGSWRAVPKGPERWWDAAMHGLEDRIERRVARVIGVRVGLEGALEVRGL